MLEIREHLAAELGDQEQLDRRRRELNKYFIIERGGSGRHTAYRLVGRKAIVESDILGISERVRAQVLQFGRCAMCGRTPAEHNVVLQVDHKMPQSWGGTNDLDNLQALCEECNRGKKDYFRTLDHLGPEIRRASEFDEPHRRLGELLKAAHPDEVRSDVLEMVAHQRQYQEDWQKRLRELRVLGWNYSTRRKKDAQGRVRVFYRLVTSKPWPNGPIRGEISRRERVQSRSR
jgi:5-methylcytosine-specific restriction endonuclease McrA